MPRLIHLVNTRGRDHQVLDSFIDVERARLISAALDEVPDGLQSDLHCEARLLEFQVACRADQSCRGGIIMRGALERDIEEPRCLCGGKPLAL